MYKESFGKSCPITYHLISLYSIVRFLELHKPKWVQWHQSSFCLCKWFGRKYGRNFFKCLMKLFVCQLEKVFTAELKYGIIVENWINGPKVASELVNCEDDDLVLQSDGTSKKGSSYTTFDVTNNERQFLVLGMQEVVAGDGQTQLDLLKEIMGHISSFKIEDIDDKSFSSVINLMSDHCNTQKKFNQLFIKDTSKIIPKIRCHWETLSWDKQNNY